MKLAYAMLADSAQFTPDGRLWMLGGDIDTLYVRSLPAKHPVLTVVFKVLFAPEEWEQEHKVRIAITNPQDATITPNDFLSFVTHESPDRLGEDVGVGVPVLIQNQEFQMTGLHLCHIWVDDQELAQLPLRIVSAPPQVPPNILDVRESKQHEETKA
jgi:hypothetical protein